MTPRVPFQNLAALHAEIADELSAAIDRVVRSGRYVLGAEVERFEHDYAVYCGSRYCVGVASGLDALKLALQVLEIGPSDEVIVPSHSYHATWLAVLTAGAKLVPIEPTPGGFLIDPAGVNAAIGPRTRAIIPVHLYGEPADMTLLSEIANSKGLALIEDAAQAHGAAWKGRRIGAHGTMTCWSFYPTKNLGCLGDGGAITTDDAALAARLRHLRNYGMNANRSLESQGINSRLDELQAAVLSVKLRNLDRWNSDRLRAAKRYHELLGGANIVLPPTNPDAGSVWHQFVIRTSDRAGVRKALADRGVDTAIHYPEPVHRQPAFAHLGMNDTAFPMASVLSETILSLPIAPGLTPKMQEWTAEVLLDFVTNTKN